jgi:hypothetical protein
MGRGHAVVAWDPASGNSALKPPYWPATMRGAPERKLS